jgi:hypothetical protein
MAYVGQRDTRWLTPLTVSSGYQGEEGNHTYQALQASHDCSAFYFEVYPGLDRRPSGYNNNIAPNVIPDPFSPKICD